MQRKFGWRGPRPYRVEEKYMAAGPVAVDHVDRMSLFRPIRDQGQEGDCTGFGSTGAVETAIHCETLSAQFNYFNARLESGTQDVDAGASIGDVVDGMVKYGFAAESIYPTIVGQYAQRPSLDAYADAIVNKGRVTPRRVTSLNGLKHALASGYPVVFGFSVPAYYESLDSSGYLPVPSASYSHFIGGHCQFFDGFDDRRPNKIIWGPGSWGAGFGKNGWVAFDQKWINDARGLIDEMYAILPA